MGRVAPCFKAVIFNCFPLIFFFTLFFYIFEVLLLDLIQWLMKVIMLLGIERRKKCLWNPFCEKSTHCYKYINKSNKFYIMMFWTCGCLEIFFFLEWLIFQISLFLFSIHSVMFTNKQCVQVSHILCQKMPYMMMMYIDYDIMKYSIRWWNLWNVY